MLLAIAAAFNDEDKDWEEMNIWEIGGRGVRGAYVITMVAIEGA